MWEKDKIMLRKYKECWANVKEQIKNGEDVDYGEVCVSETEALIKYTTSVVGNYKNNTPQEVNMKKQGYFNPKMPYFQNF